MFPAPAVLPASHRYRFLMPVRRVEWREPSLAQRKDMFGNQNRTRFRLVARLNDGHVRWRGWFDSREDADAFLDALARHVVLGEPMPRPLWELPTPAWHPEIGPHVTYDFATVQTLTSGAGSNQTWTSPSDWDSSNNTIEAIAGAGSGAVSSRSGGGTWGALGGGGGAYSAISNFSVATPGTTTETYRIGPGGVGVSSNNASGNAGGDSWFGGTTLAASSVGAKAGAAGTAGPAATLAAGGLASGGVGTVKKNGGNSGSANTSGFAASGGGGAGGPNGDGVASPNAPGSGASAGGAGDAGNGGAGSTGGSSSTSNGGSGTPPNYSGGGSGAVRSSSAATSGDGGFYGAASGGSIRAGSINTMTSGDAGQGIIVITHTPANKFSGFNMPLMGL